jgi:hypothetical protein
MGSLFGIPGMLAWGAACAIPIIIHLFTRQRYKRIPWAAMDFLLRAFKKTRRRLRLEHLLLLLLRILAILLFILALANPLLSPGALTGSPDARRQVIILLDDSFSMGLTSPDGSMPFARAIEQATRLVGSLSRERGDSVSLVTLGNPPRLLQKGETDLGAAVEELGRLELSDGGTNLVGGFGTAVAILDDLDEGAEIVVLSDLQRIGFVPNAEGVADAPSAPQQELSSLVQQVIAKKAMITFVKPRDTSTDNLAIVEMTSRSRVAVTGNATVISATVKNLGSRAQGGALNLYVDGGSEATDQRDIELIPPGQSATIDFRTTFRTEGSHFLEARFFADNLETDNRRMLSLEVRGKVKVLCVDGRPNEDPSEAESYFFAAALSPGDELDTDNIFEVNTIEEVRFDHEALDGVDLLVLMDVALISSRKATEIEKFIAAGGSMLIYLGAKTQPSVMNERLYKSGTGVLPAEILADSGPPEELSVYYTLSVQDYTHPALSYFDDPNLRQLITLSPVQRFFRVNVPREDPLVRTLITMDRDVAQVTSPVPALIEKSFGKGKTMLITTSGGDPDWNSLPAMATYVILNREIAQYLTRRELKLENLLVGDSYSRALKSFAPEVVMSRDGAQLAVLTPLTLENDQGRELRSGSLLKAGNYRFDLKLSGPEQAKDPNPIFVSVNLDPEESDLIRVDERFIKGAFPSDSVRVVDDVSSASEGQESRRKGRAWWWALLLAGIVLLLETALSQFFGSRSGREG